MTLAIQDAVSIGIEKNVNGKIKALDAKIEQYINADLQWKQIDSSWKRTAQPAIDLGNDARASSRAALFFLGLMATLTVIIGGIITAVKK